ncbi:cbb3-type cytochrome c oxidase N-terminal domain-containing protein [Larkinella rosea]|uniref:Cytochrome C n=1 Tax=Larkinella rosea TaxID=2025312 RepID=A0A3P1C0X0_9BACT|nr:cbb3-type cytochrome c oxidase N-terminal domain-containing protein [Larkinella rosea]RRB06987.1 cytochrome C [Larkinella rosea]
MNLLLILAGIEPDTRWFKIDSVDDLMLAILFSFLLVGACSLLVVAVHLYMTLKQLTESSPIAKPIEKPLTFWQRFTGLAPLKMERELVMEHEYDGIEELDNPTPPWFMTLFYGTIGIGVIYLLIYHVFSDGNIMVREYTQDMAIAEKERAAYIAKVAGSINENTVTLLKTPDAIAAGKAVFTQFCVACHGQNAEGVIGPNLTDAYWLHGGSVKAVFQTITDGVPEKGMVPWKKQLNPLQIQQIASYILSLQGSNPTNAKEPQGEKVALND